MKGKLEERSKEGGKPGKDGTAGRKERDVGKEGRKERE
jgi:hypothetical protein